MISGDTVLDQIRIAGIEDGLLDKFQGLLDSLARLGSAVVAYSGGVDSSFLSYAASLALGDQMVAVTLNTTLEAGETVEFATSFARQAGFKHVIVTYDALQNAGIRANPADRCYHCKTVMLGLVRKYAAEHGYTAVLEGQNADDEQDYRPGRKAVAENGALSPLAQAGFTKPEIRKLAHALGLPIWDRPSSPCLASRVPYGTALTPEALRQIAQGEAFLRQRGFSPVRVRWHIDLARIEVAPEQIARLAAIHDEINAYFKGIGFKYVSIDLQGYRQGSLNEALGL